MAHLDSINASGRFAKQVRKSNNLRAARNNLTSRDEYFEKNCSLIPFIFPRGA